MIFDKERVCVLCAKDHNLKLFINEHGERGSCSLCKKEEVSIETDKQDFSMLFKALIRYHFSEWEYNRHHGGDSIESLFFEENPILNFQFNNDLENLELVILSIIDGKVYEDYDKGVSLYAGYYNGLQNPLLKALKSERSRRLARISRELEHNNYYEYEDELHELIVPFFDVIKKSVDEGAFFYRARAGVKDEKSSIEGGYEAEKHYQPFTHKDIGAPPPNLASGGRINRDGVSFFYGATNVDTAISEIRPHPGDKVSIGKFVTVEKLTLADFSENKLIHYFQSDKNLDEEFVLLNSVNIYLNKLVTPTTRSHYSITQLIADVIRKLGFDGILFNSTVGGGNNVALFYPQHVTFDDSFALVRNVRSLSYVFDDMPLIERDGLYQEDYIASLKQ